MEQRDKINTEETPKSSKMKHSSNITDEKQMIDSVNTLESVFVSLSSAVRSASSKTQNEEESSVTLDSQAIIGIVKIIAGALALIVLFIVLYKARNRVNKLISRVVPKSRFPPASYLPQLYRQFTQAQPQNIAGQQQMMASPPPLPQQRQPNNSAGQGVQQNFGQGMSATENAQNNITPLSVFDHMGKLPKL